MNDLRFALIFVDAGKIYGARLDGSVWRLDVFELGASGTVRWKEVPLATNNFADLLGDETLRTAPRPC